MFQGNWSCSSCNTGIKELPFEPKNTSNLLCRDCHSKQRGGGGSGQSFRPQGERKMVQGDWKCNGCNGDIKELPFQPRETGNLLCRDCFKNKR